MARACSVCISNCLRLHGAQGQNELDAGAATTKEKERSPSFLKKMAKSTMRSLKLPLSFVRGQIDTLDACVVLEGPSRGKWKVELQGSFKTFNLHFGQGWEKFVADHALQVDDLLTFSLSAKSYFQVEVYDGGGCLKTSALDAEVAETQVTEPVVNAVQTARSVATRPVVETGAEPVGSVAGIGEAEVEAARSVEIAEAARSISGIGERSEGLYEPDSEAARSLEVAEATRSVSGIGDRSEGLYDPDSEDDKVSEQKLLPEHQLVKGSVLSRRPPVTELERDRALQAAKSLELANPSVLIVMSKQNVYKGFWLAIAKQFAKDWMPLRNHEVKLVNRGGHSWTVKWIAARSGLSSGWRRFSLDHRLEEHDVCVLEMIDTSRYVLLARIFRVLQSPEEDPGLYPHTVSPEKKTKRKLSSPVADGEGSHRKNSRRGAQKEPERGLPDDDITASPGDHIQNDAEATPTASLEHNDSALPGDDITSPADAPTRNPEAEDRRETSALEGTRQGPALTRCGQDDNRDSEQPRKAHSQQGKRVLDPDSVSISLSHWLAEASGKEPEKAGPSNREYHVTRANGSVLALICYQNSRIIDRSAYVDPDSVHEQIMHVPELPWRKQQMVRVHREKKETQQEYKVVHIYGGRDVGNGAEFLSELEGYKGGTESVACLDRDDDTGFWWVPHEHFGWDMMRCYLG